MAIHLSCPNGHHLTAKEANAGKKGKCPVCKIAVAIPNVHPDRLTESAVLDILGSPEPSRSSAMAVGAGVGAATGFATLQKPSTILGRGVMSSSLPMSKVCPNCERDIDVGYHICPYCHTYLTGLSEF